MVDLYLLIFFFGLCLGSFLNVIIYRLDKKISALKGRSRCPKCRKLIKWYDNIPLVSFFLLKGRCRHCQQKISWQYPLVELTTGIIFLINALVISEQNNLLNLNFNTYLAILMSWIFSAFLVIIFVYDLKKYLILDKVVLPLIIIALIYNLFNFSLIKLLIGGIIGLGFFLIQYIVSKGQWIGEGDLRLGLAMGFILGFPKILIAILLSYFIGSLVAISLVIIKKKPFKSRIPLGPFLTVGTYLTMIFGDYLLELMIF